MNTATMNSTAAARVYVGTYAAYNSGSIRGAWLDLEDYEDKEAFMEAAQALHCAENDPELMFQDWEGVPAGMVSESHIGEEVWTWLALDATEKEAVAAYHEGIDSAETEYSYIMEKYQGSWDSEQAYVEAWVDDVGMMADWPEEATRYFDIESFTRDVFIDDANSVRYGSAVHVFLNH